MRLAEDARHLVAEIPGSKRDRRSARSLQGKESRLPMSSPIHSTSPDPDEVRRAIREHRLVEFYYTGELIVAEPYLHGLGPRYAAPILLAWDAIHGWREYSFMRIRRFRVMDRCYPRTRDDYDPQDPRMKRIDTAATLRGRELRAG
jgi:predicted DNA-binding transcriptional regulator YafY